ncbi:MAG TPA: hypothetical protein ENK54_09555 [Thiotrichales bacterium]|nr:hypothetical protein [Thiotrichales bacterium]
MPDRHHIPTLRHLLPWGAGAGFAVGQATLTTGCTVVSLGRCSGCAGCLLALASLVGWAALREGEGKERATDRGDAS